MSGSRPRFGADRWKAVTPYLDRALDLSEMDAAAREQWLDSVRREDPDLAADLEHLLEERRAVIEEGFLDDDSIVPRPEPSLAGLVVGSYRLLTLLGQGGMGTVWLAARADGRFDGRAAVKLLNVSLIGAHPSRGEERFRREGTLLARLAHPNIARLIDAGVTTGGQPYLVLEYIDGEPIDRYCDSRALSVEARIRLFLEVLDAVAHAHANLVVHRDLKPSNVLVSADARVKLLDFGIAKLLQADDVSVLTREGGAALTPEFAAPEQVTGHEVTTATDVYALGVLLYLLLGGCHPVGEGPKSPADLVKAIVDTDPPKVSETIVDPGTDAGPQAARRATTPEKLRRLLRGDLDTIVATALKKNPTERYVSVTALADDLRRYLAHEPIRAREDTLAYRAAKFARRHLHAVIAAIAMVTLIGVLVVFYTTRLAAERDRARIEAAKSAKVSELMTDLLTAADPFRDKPDPTVRDLLDAGAARLPQELAGQPEILADMLTAIGRVYQRLEVLDKAQPLLEQALALGRGLQGGEHPRVAQTLNDLGVLLRMKGDAAASVSMLEESLALRRKLLGARHKDVAVTLSELGRSYGALGQANRAESLAREALELRRSVLGEVHRETATSMGDLGLMLWQRGDLAGAEPLLRRSLEISRQVLGEYHANVGSALSNLALVVADRGNYAAAEPLFRQAVEVRRRALGAHHPGLAVTLNNLAYALRELRKYDEAVAAMNEALSLSLPAGEESPAVANYRANLARVYIASSRPEAAEPLLRRSLDVRLRVYGANDWRVAMTKSLLGDALTGLGRYAEAEPLLLDARRLLKEVPGPQGREARATATRLRTLYESRDRAAASALQSRVAVARSR